MSAALFDDPACNPNEPPERGHEGADLSWMDLVQAPLLAVSADGRRVLRGNPQSARLLGLPPAGQSLAALLGGYPAGRLAALLAAGSAAGEMVLYCHAPIGLCTLGFRAAPLPGGGTLLTLADHDASAGERIRSDADFGRMLEEIIRSLPVGVEIYDDLFHELYCNTLSDELFGYDYDGILPHHDAWFDIAFPDPVQRREVIAEWRACLVAARTERDVIQKTEWDVVCRDGQRRTVQFRFRFIGDTYIVVFWDITARRRLEDELRQLAETDELTGLFNRRHFFQQAERLMAEAPPGTVFGLLMLDVDHFKDINDRHGHGVGDLVLQEIAARCRAVLRPGDLVARMGGEEFAVLLVSAGAEIVAPLAQRLRSAIGAEPVAVGDAWLRVEASIGATWVAPGAGTIAEALERADRALYAAKDGGRNRVVIVPPPGEEAP